MLTTKLPIRPESADYLGQGGFKLNAHVPNLNDWHFCTAYDEGDGRLEDHSAVSGNVEVVFRDLEQRLIGEINSATAVVGCVAWLTSFPILEALRKKYCQLVVQKEDFLRPDIGAGDAWKTSLRARYDALGVVYRYGLPGVIKHMSYAGEPSIESVRCVGNYNRDKNPAFPRMHNKFLVFGDINSVDGEDYVAPKAVWTGSFNLTKNAGYSFENALIIRDPVIVNAYAQEYGQIAGLSEPLDWQSDWSSPEFRLGS